MEKQDNYTEGADGNGGSFETGFDCSSQSQLFHQARQSSEAYEQQQKWQHQQHQQLMFETNVVMSSEMQVPVERTLSFADVMQFADFGPKLALHHPHQHDYNQHNQNNIVDTNNNNNNIDRREENRTTGFDPVNFLKFPVLSNPDVGLFNYNNLEQDSGGENIPCDYNNPVLQLEFLGSNANDNGTSNNATDENVIDMSGEKINGGENVEGGVVGKSSGGSSKRKRPRTIKTTEEVESQRMTHIAVERNRRKQMNEHLRVLRSLMPSSYVQRGDQASIIGGAIEFVRELEQLLQCLESQKRRKLYGDQPGPPRPGEDATSPSTMGQFPQQQPLGFPPPLPRPAGHSQDDQTRAMDQLDPIGGGMLLEEESAESKSCIADVEVKVLGFDALIKILSRRRPGQLVKAIAALEDLQLSILHTNITTIEQTVLYSFNVKVGGEARFTAEDIATSIQQIFTFIHANTDII